MSQVINITGEQIANAKAAVQIAGSFDKVNPLVAAIAQVGRPGRYRIVDNEPVEGEPAFN